MRLIDADALEDVLVNHGFCYCGENEYNDGVADGFLLARDDVKQAPTIDAVEVVRCKDCKYYESKCDYPFCYYTENNVETDDYCSFGEKREVEE